MLQQINESRGVQHYHTTMPRVPQTVDMTIN